MHKNLAKTLKLALRLRLIELAKQGVKVSIRGAML